MEKWMAWAMLEREQGGVTPWSTGIYEIPISPKLHLFLNDS